MVTKADLKKVIDSQDEATLDRCISELQSQHGLDRSEARVQLLTSTRQEYVDGDTLLEWDDDAEFEDFTADAQGKTFESDDTESPDTPDSPSVGEEVEWESGAEVFSEENVDIETPPETNEEFYHLSIRADEGHPLVPDSRAYFSQKVANGVSDVEEFTFAVDDNDFGVLLTGEPGTGKGHMVKHVAAEANVPLIRINMGTGITKEKLIGGYTPRANGEGLNGQLDRAKEIASENNLSVGEALETLSVREKFVWKDGWFTKAFKNGWWILLDEINAAPPEAMMPFFGALEDAKSRSLELTERSQTIKPHSGFRLIATRNPVHHKGTNPMNDALKDRMFEIQKEYLPDSAEKRLIKSQTGLDDDEAGKLVEIAGALRTAYPDQISRTLTPRGEKRIGKWAELYGFETAIRKELLEGIDFEDEKDPIERKIEQVL
jgi:MoxR-like ATPase